MLLKTSFFAQNTPLSNKKRSALAIFLGGEALEKLDPIELWDITIVLSRAALLSNSREPRLIDIQEAIDMSDCDPTQLATPCLHALDGFPVSQVNLLMAAMLQIAYDDEAE